MSADEDTELRDLVVKIMEDKGIFGRLKAELRACVFLALEREGEYLGKIPIVNKKLREFAATKDGIKILSLIHEFFEFFGMHITLAVFEPESSVKFLSRREIEDQFSAVDIQADQPVISELVRYCEMGSSSTVTIDKPGVSTKALSDKFGISSKLGLKLDVGQTSSEVLKAGAKRDAAFGIPSSSTDPFYLDDIKYSSKDKNDSSVSSGQQTDSGGTVSVRRKDESYLRQKSSKKGKQKSTAEEESEKRAGSATFSEYLYGKSKQDELEGGLCPSGIMSKVEQKTLSTLLKEDPLFQPSGSKTQSALDVGSTTMQFLFKDDPLVTKPNKEHMQASSAYDGVSMCSVESDSSFIEKLQGKRKDEGSYKYSDSHLTDEQFFEQLYKKSGSSSLSDSNKPSTSQQKEDPFLEELIAKGKSSLQDAFKFRSQPKEETFIGRKPEKCDSFVEKMSSLLRPLKPEDVLEGSDKEDEEKVKIMKGVIDNLYTESKSCDSEELIRAIDAADEEHLKIMKRVVEEAYGIGDKGKHREGRKLDMDEEKRRLKNIISQPFYAVNIEESGSDHESSTVFTQPKKTLTSSSGGSLGIHTKSEFESKLFSVDKGKKTAKESLHTATSGSSTESGLSSLRDLPMLNVKTSSSSWLSEWQKKKEHSALEETSDQSKVLGADDTSASESGMSSHKSMSAASHKSGSESSARSGRKSAGGSSVKSSHKSAGESSMKSSYKSVGESMKSSYKSTGESDTRSGHRYSHETSVRSRHRSPSRSSGKSGSSSGSESSGKSVVSSRSRSGRRSRQHSRSRSGSRSRRSSESRSSSRYRRSSQRRSGGRSRHSSRSRSGAGSRRRSRSRSSARSGHSSQSRSSAKSGHRSDSRSTLVSRRSSRSRSSTKSGHHSRRGSRARSGHGSGSESSARSGHRSGGGSSARSSHKSGSGSHGRSHHKSGGRSPARSGHKSGSESSTRSDHKSASEMSGKSGHRSGSEASGRSGSETSGRSSHRSELSGRSSHRSGGELSGRSDHRSGSEHSGRSSHRSGSELSRSAHRSDHSAKSSGRSAGQSSKVSGHESVHHSGSSGRHKHSDYRESSEQSIEEEIDESSIDVDELLSSLSIGEESTSDHTASHEIKAGYDYAESYLKRKKK